MSDIEEAKQAWTHYWNHGDVAETFGGKEELERNPKYFLEEKPIAILIPKCTTLLDAGCGVGRYTQLVKDKCRIYVGIDYSKNMLDQARKNNPFANVVYWQGDLETMDFAKVLADSWLALGSEEELQKPAPSKFDVGLLIAVIRHLPPEKGLNVLRKVAKACKILFFTCFIVPEEQEIQIIIKGTEGNKIIDIPYHLSDLKKALDLEELLAISLGDRDPTVGQRYLFKIGKFDALKEEISINQVLEQEQSSRKPLNRIVTIRKAVHGE